MSMQIVRCNHRRRYSMRRTLHGWQKFYEFFTVMADPVYPGFDGYWSSISYKSFEKYCRKEIEVGEITNVHLKFLPIVKKAFVGYDHERRHFIVRGRSPRLGYTDRKYMFGNAVRMRDDKTVGKRREVYTMRPWNPRRL